MTIESRRACLATLLAPNLTCAAPGASGDDGAPDMGVPAVGSPRHHARQLRHCLL